MHNLFSKMSISKLLFYCIFISKSKFISLNINAQAVCIRVVSLIFSHIWEDVLYQQAIKFILFCFFLSITLLLGFYDKLWDITVKVMVWGSKGNSTENLQRRTEFIIMVFEMYRCRTFDEVGLKSEEKKKRRKEGGHS